VFQDILVRVKCLDQRWQNAAFKYETSGSAGVDLRACLDQEEISMAPGMRRAIGTGIAIEILSPSVAGFVFSRSGLGTQEGLVVSQGVGVIDPDYRGEIIVSLMNTSETCHSIRQGQRIAQLVFMPVCQARFFIAQELTPSARGSGGFGHTGNY
jgi:dUTP pyrophosphatase